MKQKEKVTQKSVNYVDPSPHSDKYCGNCSMYENWTCTLVRGVIDPAAYCDEWDPKVSKKK